MAKIKATKLLEELLINSQNAFISEDEHIILALNDIIKTSPIPDCETILKIVNTNNEFLRMSIIKTIITTLIQNDLIENNIVSLDESIKEVVAKNF